MSIRLAARLARITLVVATLTMVTHGACAEDPKTRLENSPRHHEWVDIKTDQGRTVRSFVVYPEVDHDAMVMIVIHENRGLNDWARSAADQVAEAGYIAIAPDLLSGTGPNGGGTKAFESEDAAREGIYELKQEQVTSDLDAVFKHAKQMDAASGKVGVMGFCWGGGQTFHYATQNPELAVACVFYGSGPTEEELLKKIKAPVYGFYGGNDQRITGAVPKVAEKMKSLEKQFDATVYEGAGHGFMRSGEIEGAEQANVEGRAEAWKKLRAVLAKSSQQSPQTDAN